MFQVPLYGMRPAWRLHLMTRASLRCILLDRCVCDLGRIFPNRLTNLVSSGVLA